MEPEHGITCSVCRSVDHYPIQCPVRKEQVRQSYIYRLNNIVTGPNFKKYGSHSECKCALNSRMDPFLKESVVEAWVCHYCEWANCDNCKTVDDDGFEIRCDKCNMN